MAFKQLFLTGVTKGENAAYRNKKSIFSHLYFHVKHGILGENYFVLFKAF